MQIPRWPQRREPLEILADILRVVKDLGAGAERVPPSKITSKVFVAYDRGQRYLEAARRLDFLDAGDHITERGERYLLLWHEVEKLLRSAPPLSTRR